MTPRDQLRCEGIVWIDGFLSADACAGLIEELEFAFWWPSTVVNRSRAGAMVSFSSRTRQSETTSQEWFTSDLMVELDKAERRLCRMFGLRRDHLEPWQATRYRRGGRFDPHDDGGLFAEEPAGERTKTLLLYLDTPGAGGATSFTERDILVCPEAGRLVAWNNLLPDGTVDRAMRHASMPVQRGTKTTLVTWARQHKVRVET